MSGSREASKQGRTALILLGGKCYTLPLTSPLEIFSLGICFSLRVSSGYTCRIIKNIPFLPKDTQVEFAQSNTLLQAGEIMLLKHFAGHVLKISKYGHSLCSLAPASRFVHPHNEKFPFYLMLQLVSVASFPTTIHL